MGTNYGTGKLSFREERRERLKAILEYVQGRGETPIKEMSGFIQLKWGVSDGTVQRDIETLKEGLFLVESDGKLRRGLNNQ